MAICPDTGEKTLLRVCRQIKSGVLEMDYAGEKMYCKVGDVYVGLRSVDVDYNIYQGPDFSYKSENQLYSDLKISVLDIYEDWIKIKTVIGIKNVEGWVHNCSFFECYDSLGVVKPKMKTEDNKLEVEREDGTISHCQVGEVNFRYAPNRGEYPVYSGPDTTSKIVGYGFSEKDVPISVVVLDAQDDWLKVRAFVLPDSFIEGWIPPTTWTVE